MTQNKEKCNGKFSVWPQDDDGNDITLGKAYWILDTSQKYATQKNPLKGSTYNIETGDIITKVSFWYDDRIVLGATQICQEYIYNSHLRIFTDKIKFCAARKELVEKFYQKKCADALKILEY